MMKTFIPKTQILPEAQKKIWSQLEPSVDLGMILYGGTAIALQLGHRTSIDFDFFQQSALDKKIIYKNFAFTKNSTLIQDDKDTLTILVPVEKEQNVKISFFGNIRCASIQNSILTKDLVLRVANLDVLMATKLKVLMQRIELKDYLDIAALIKNDISLADGLLLAEKNYQPTFQPAECLKVLVYFDDNELNNLSIDDKKTLINAVSKISSLNYLKPKQPFI